MILNQLLQGREIELYALHDRPMRAKRRRRRLARIRLKREKKQKKGVKKEIGDAKEEMDVDRIKNAWSQDADEQVSIFNFFVVLLCMFKFLIYSMKRNSLLPTKYRRCTRCIHPQN